jgi:two-component system chemotaxis response regulator CheB
VPDSGCDVVVVGASAGGVEALSALARALPADFGAPVVVVLHVAPSGTSILPEILSRAGPLPARHVGDGEELRAGRIYVAPPNCHVLIADRKVVPNRGPRENGHRPAIDPLFRSAADAYEGRTAGVVCSGTLSDGAAGLFAIKERGGATLVQDPAEALYTSMPNSAIRQVEPDYVLPMSELATVLVRLTTKTSDARSLTEDTLEDPEAAPGQREPSAPSRSGRMGPYASRADSPTGTGSSRPRVSSAAPPSQ